MSVALHVLGTADETLAERFLAAHADSSFSLCRNIAAGLVDADRRHHGLWASALEDADLADVPVIR